MVDVNTQNKTISVNVSSSGVSSNVNASGDTSHYYSEKAREWAISNRIVDGVDYSSKYYANKSNQSALNAQSFAQSALETLNNVDNKVQEATENIEIQKQDVITEIQDIATNQKEEIENLSEQEQNKIVDLGIDTRANIDLGNLSSLGEKHFLNKSQITNCITEIPQDIKLEFNNGVLTLKAGSKVYVPNGFEADGTTPKFDVVVIESDVTRNATGSASGKSFFCYDVSSKEMTWATEVQSGDNATITNGFAYNTTLNEINVYFSGSISRAKVSLPIAVCTSTSGAISSLDQVFNGVGYIGSTVWVDKGVKYLVPDGRNEDGSLKNIEFTINRIIPSTLTFGAQDYYLSLNEYGETIIFTAKTVTKYDSDRNVVIDTYANINRLWCFAGECTADINNKITSFSVKQPFRAMDYNDFANIPHITQTYTSGTSWYRIYSDGWCEQGGYSATSNVTITLLKTYANTNYTITLGKAFSNETNTRNPNIVSTTKTTAQFKVTGTYNNTAGTDCYFYWETKGYMA